MERTDSPKFGHHTLDQLPAESALGRCKRCGIERCHGARLVDRTRSDGLCLHHGVEEAYLDRGFARFSQWQVAEV